MTRERESSSNKHKKLCYSMISKQEQRLRSTLKVFAVFFHPTALVTAMGGAEKRFVETLKTFCREDDVEITVLESAPSLLPRMEVTCKKFLLPLNFHGIGWLSTYLEWILWIVKASLKSLSLVRHVKPNVILVPNNTLPNLVSGYISGFIFQQPICVVVHHIDVPFYKNESKDHSLYSCYRKVKYSKLVSLIKTLAFYVSLPLLRRAKAIIAVSNFTAKVLMNNNLFESKIFVSGNAVDFNFINAVEPYHEEKIFDGVFVGRIAKEKGIFDLLNVWKKIVRVRKGAKLLIVGSGLELQSVKREIGTLGLENNIIIRGRCADRELYSLLKSGKVFIFPSLFEGWGIAVAEALACGLPVVAYDIPALREVFGKCESVFFASLKNIESMTSIILDILDLNDKEVIELSDYSRAYARQFSWEKVAEKDLKFLRTLLE